MNSKSEKISFLLLLPTLESFHTVHPICFRKASGPALAVSSRIRLLATSRVMYSSSSSSLRRISSSRVGSVLCMATCTSYVVVAVGAVGSGGGRFERTEYKVDVGRRRKRESINYSRHTLMRSRNIIMLLVITHLLSRTSSTMQLYAFLQLFSTFRCITTMEKCQRKEENKDLV